jgi:hypothetical protein
MDLPELSGIERAVLTGPDVIARTAARTVESAEQRWLLRQPRAVRCSFVEEVLGAGRGAAVAERWMLLQSDAVRRSYVSEVLDGG